MTVDNPPDTPFHRAIAEEQPRVTLLYGRLDLLRKRIADRLNQQFRKRGSTHREVWERDAFVARDVDRLARLDAVEPGLCFGRLDLTDHARRYIGRVALADDDYEPLLIDWRAPAAAPFYRATPANPGDVARRRHIRTSRRQVTAVDDEVFGLELPADAGEVSLSGEAALLASLQRHRTGRMADIVATIQAEQDRIIRSPLKGVLVVHGGPGTGKTVAALHRAAYLLYTYRDQLANRGVLVIGPNPTFLRYIEQVLPALGETGVVLATLSTLYPGVAATRTDTDEAARLKGDVRMTDVIAAAVRDVQRVPANSVDVIVDGRSLRVEPGVVAEARTKARRARRPHNDAREIFVRDILTALANQQVSAAGHSLDETELPAMRDDLADEPAVAKMLDELWPIVIPEQLLTDLFSSPERIRRATQGWADADRAQLYRRPTPDAWTVADVPLLDEAAELLGEAPATSSAAARAAAAQQQADIAYARDLLEQLDLSMPVDAEQVAQRYQGRDASASTAERAASDRSWAFGHVIVDEAQELSPMAWRMIIRRCPSRSMTLVGDLAQTGSPAGASSWGDALEPHVPGRWRLEELGVNYRTPAEIMAVAGAVLAEIDPALRLPQSVRHSGTVPWARRVGSLADELQGIVGIELATIGEGRLAIIVPDDLHAELSDRLTGPNVARGDDPAALDSTAVVLTVTQAKGLEFDSVIVVDPAGLVEAADRRAAPTLDDQTRPRGLRDLYVAITRATGRLGIVYTGELPAPLGQLRHLDRDARIGEV